MQSYVASSLRLNPCRLRVQSRCPSAHCDINARGNLHSMAMAALHDSCLPGMSRLCHTRTRAQCVRGRLDSVDTHSSSCVTCRGHLSAWMAAHIRSPQPYHILQRSYRSSTSWLLLLADGVKRDPAGPRGDAVSSSTSTSSTSTSSTSTDGAALGASNTATTGGPDRPEYPPSAGPASAIEQSSLSSPGPVPLSTSPAATVAAAATAGTATAGTASRARVKISWLRRLPLAFYILAGRCACT